MRRMTPGLVAIVVALIATSAKTARADIGMTVPQFSIIRPQFLFVPQTTVPHQYPSRIVPTGPLLISPLHTQTQIVQPSLIEQQMIHQPLGLQQFNFPYNAFTSDPRDSYSRRARHGVIAGWGAPSEQKSESADGASAESGGGAQTGPAPRGASTVSRRQPLGW